MLSKVTGTNTGTDGFIAPEITTESGTTEKVDIFSFGMTMWQLLHPDKKLLQVLHERVTPPNTVQSAIAKELRPTIYAKILPEDKDLFELMKDCWNAKPEKRPSWGQIIARLIGKPVGTQPPLKKVKVLTLDGGGARGLIMALILEEIENRTKKQVC